MTLIPPGSVLGIVGGGQLGRMTALAAAELGYRVHIFCPETESPALDVVAQHTCAPYDDEDALERFARAVDVITLEWENLPLSSMQKLAGHKSLYPQPAVLAIAQDRRLEKAFAQSHGIGTAPFAPVQNLNELERALDHLAGDAILKSACMGYDGKGQLRLAPGDDPEQAWDRIGRVPCVLESFVDFLCEVSVIVARGQDGAMAAYPVVQNTHKDHILAETLAPAPHLPPAIAAEAQDLALRLADALKIVGLLAVEMFVLNKPNEAGMRVIMNEIAPRPHNSGHWTIDACAISQYEQLVRAVCGLPLGSPQPHSRARMINLLGNDAQDWARHMKDPTARLHLYGKRESRPGRKMGHVTYLTGPWQDTPCDGAA